MITIKCTGGLRSSFVQRDLTWPRIACYVIAMAMHQKRPESAKCSRRSNGRLAIVAPAIVSSHLDHSSHPIHKYNNQDSNDTSSEKIILVQSPLSLLLTRPRSLSFLSPLLFLSLCSFLLSPLLFSFSPCFLCYEDKATR